MDENGDLQIRVSAMGDWRYESLVGIHEAVEAVLCKDRRVPFKTIDAFDEEYESMRERFLASRPKFGNKQHSSNFGDPIDAESEPGDDSLAPYRDEHCFATAVERMLCAALGLSWAKYEAVNLALYETDTRGSHDERSARTP